MFLFSATLEGDSVELFAERILNDPALLEAESSRKEKRQNPPVGSLSG